MSLTLLCGASAPTCPRGPAVRLQAGRWKLQCKDIVHSTLVLILESSGEIISVQDDTEFVLETPETVWLEFRDRGREGSLTINAKKIG